MTDADALLEAIRSDPDADAPRLVYADWLQEHGEADRAEFIRTQVELARLPPDYPQRPVLEARERELLTAPAFVRSFNLLEEVWPGWRDASVQFFRRGFVDGLWIYLSVLVGRAAELFDTFPLLQRVVVRPWEQEASAHFADWARSPYLARLRALELTNGSIGDAGAVALAESPHARGLRRLVLRHA